jgi:hypothetical protein
MGSLKKKISVVSADIQISKHKSLIPEILIYFCHAFGANISESCKPATSNTTNAIESPNTIDMLFARRGERGLLVFEAS